MSKASFYEVWHFPDGVGPEKPYLVPNDPEGIADEPPPSFKKKQDAEKFRKELFGYYPDESLRVVRITQEILSG